MIKKHSISILFLSVAFSSYASPPSNLGYESGEHIFMGEQITLQGLPASKFTLDNGLTLTYGEIISMPDFYGDSDHQISDENTLENQKTRFLKTFNDFENSDVAYFNAFWPVIQDERNQIKAGIAAGESPSAVYKRIIGAELLKLEWVTGFKYFALAEKSFDHFGEDAWTAYQAGHSVAIETALAGYQISSGRDLNVNQHCAVTENPPDCIAKAAQEKLARAYAQNAFSNHFLSDRLASSHMRTPFRALVNTATLPSLGAIAGNYMHNEDGRYGVIVTDNSEKYWVAYGDDYYFEPENATHRAVIGVILQKSADEIYDAYVKGYDTDPYSEQLQAILPTPIPPGAVVNIPGIGLLRQSSPLFVTVGDAVQERKEVNDPYTYVWTPQWTTLQLISTYHLTELSSPIAEDAKKISNRPIAYKIIPPSHVAHSRV